MMVQSSNQISVQTGVESLSSFQMGLSPEISKTAGFNTDFLQQLQMLQANLGKNETIDSNLLSQLQAQSQQQSANGGGNSLAEDVQNFAALLGKTTTTANKFKPEINLDDTLNTLADVLQYIQGLNSQSENTGKTQKNSGNENSSEASNMSNGDSQVQSIQPVDPTALSLDVARMLPKVIDSSTPQTIPQAPTQTASLMPAQLQKAQQLLIDNSNQLTAQLPNPGMQVANLGGAAPNIKTESGKTDKNPETVSSSVQFDDNQGLVVNNPKIGEGGTGANSGLTPQHSGQDKQALADADAEDIQLAAKQTNQIETDKFVTRMNNEIAQLNQSVQTSKPTEMDVISKPFGHPDWNNELGQKLIWMHKQDMPSAELRLNPEHLGPISVKIDVNHDMTTISFTAQHAEVKEAIEAAIPKLREMLGGQLSSSLDVNVSQQSDQKSANAFFQSASGQGQGKQSGQNPEFGHSEANPKIELVDEIDAGRASVSNGLLSLFA